MNDYSYLEHKHRFAAWTSSTAASASSKCRFKVSAGLDLLTQVNISKETEDLLLLTVNKNWSHKYDSWHHSKCNELIEASSIKGFTYGVAAKLVNVYVKTFYLSSMEMLSVVHPPIDRILLESLKKNNFLGKKKIWAKYERKGWSKFNDNDYLDVISNLREGLTDMWQIEYFWQGYQD